MECRYCQTWNAEDDHRCRRCGRRLRMTPPYSASAAAPALHYDPRAHAIICQPAATQPEIAAKAEPAPAGRKSVTYQPSLFSSRELPRVVAFENFAPEAVQAPPRSIASPAARPRSRRTLAGQQSLEFSAVRSARPSEGVIYCDAPVAIPMRRLVAAALDGAMVFIAVAVFGLVFHFAGGQFVLNARTVPMLLAVIAVLLFLYKLLWCFTGSDSAGMSWTHLTLVNFDGQTPSRQQRLYRAVSGFLSVLAGGIGLIWALVDEETLTWHDHISRTFPTPY